jgi:hypothetical protein
MPEAVNIDDREIIRQTDSTIAEGNHLTSASSQTSSARLGNSANYAAPTESFISGPDVEIQTLNDAAAQTSPFTLSTTQRLLSKSAGDDNSELILGQMLSRSIKANHKSKLYNAGRLEIQIEYSPGPSHTASNSAPRILVYGIKWLTTEEAERLQEHQSASVIDAESVDDEISVEIDERNCIYIAGRGSMLKVLLRSQITWEYGLLIVNGCEHG